MSQSYAQPAPGYLIVINTPGIVAVELADMKQHLQLEVAFTADDALLDDYTRASQDAIEKHLRRYLVNTAITVYWDYPPGAVVRLPGGWCQSITSVDYRDTSEAAQVLASSVYWEDLLDVLGGRIDLRDGSAWPEVSTRPNSFSVTYTAGYGALAENVPEALRACVRQMTADLYLNRGATTAGKLMDNNPMYKRMMGGYVVPKLS